MAKYYVSIKDKGGKFNHFDVPKEVYVYIKQLESFIKDSKNSKLKDLYAERFK